jgi:hypothetical protein
MMEMERDTRKSSIEPALCDPACLTLAFAAVAAAHATCEHPLEVESARAIECERGPLPDLKAWT